MYNMQRLDNKILFTFEDVQKVLQECLKSKGSGILCIDANYLYSFHVSDMDYVSKICKLTRYNKETVFLWHDMLERWYNDQTVRDSFGREIKPKQLVRVFDRIVNEGLGVLAGALTGQGDSNFHYHALGEGEVTVALPSDKQLVDEINRIDVNRTNDGGSLTKEGSTIYVVGNHPSSLPSANITESGVFNAQKSPDLMLDHSIFDNPIIHDQFEDSAGSTTVIYMCSV